MMASRIFILFIAIVAVWSLTLARGAYLQLFPNERLDQLRKRQFEKIITLRARRGLIYDRNNREVAVSVPSYSLFLDPHLISNRDETSRKLSQVIGVSSGSIARILKKNKARRFVWLKRQVPENIKDKVSALRILGVGFIEEPTRVYPNNNLMAQLLGFVGSEGQGLEGVEYLYNKTLLGEDHRVQVQRDARGRPLFVDGQVLNINPDGSNLYLTLDAELQFFVESELLGALQEFNAERATGLVLDVKTGEIVASASVPHFNPNAPLVGKSSWRKNHVITDAYEPGSVMKTFVMAAAIKKGTLQPNTRIDCEGGTLKVADRTIREAETDHKFGILTATEILAHSSNVGSVKIALNLVGSEYLRQTLSEFGFGSKLEVDLPGESGGTLLPLPWNPHLTANVSFGHGLATTPLQVAAAYAAIASGGVLRKPYVVQKIYNEDRKETTAFSPTELRRVLTVEQAQTLTLMLMSATGEDGTGATARVPGYPVAGKTGTAQKVDFEKGGYKKGSYISSFAGFIPAQDPKYVIYVAVDDPKNDYYAAKVAAPLFSRIAGFAMRRAGIPPVLIEEKNLVQKNSQRRQMEDQQKRALAQMRRSIEETDVNLVPNVVGLSLREAYGQFKNSGLRILPSGYGKIVETSPEAGAPLPRSRVVRVYLESAESVGSSP